VTQEETLSDPLAVPPLPKPLKATLMFPPKGKSS